MLRALLLTWLGLAFAASIGACGDAEPATGATADALVDSTYDALLPPSEVGPDLAVCAAGTPCDDGDPCTVDDACDEAGVCVGAAMDCDDGITCTIDGCVDGACENRLEAGYCVTAGGTCAEHDMLDPDGGCATCLAEGDVEPTWLPIEDGSECDDHDICTTGEQCLGGACVPKGLLPCLDGGPCFETGCDPTTGCFDAPLPEGTACEDGDACTEGDACDASQVCTPGTALACDDGDPCTNDTCHEVAGCVFIADVCDDEDACTIDACASDGTCSNTPFDGPCEDGDACTEGESCASGSCGGGTVVVCDDGNDCTVDSCEAASGCVYLYSDAACDDGIECTVGDSCVAGVCVGTKQWCPECPVPVTDQAQKMVAFSLGEDGMPGSGLDVDQDVTTCQPTGSCTAGIDNTLGILAPVINQGIVDALEAGTLTYVADFEQATIDGQPFPFAVHFATLHSSNLSCDIQAEPCVWEVSQILFNGDCSPMFLMEGATIVDGMLVAGGPGTVIALVLPLAPGVQLPLTIAWARFEAQVVVDEAAGTIQSLDGLLAGAVAKSQLLDAIENADEEALPFDKAVLIPLLDTIIENDVDLDGDGSYDAASVGFQISAIPASLVTPEGP